MKSDGENKRGVEGAEVIEEKRNGEDLYLHCLLVELAMYMLINQVNKQVEETKR